MRQPVAGAGLETRFRSLKRCVEEQCTLHSPFRRLEAVTPVTVAASADWAHKDAIRGVGGMRDVRCGSLLFDAVLVQPAHLVSVPGWRALVARPSSSHSTTSHDARRALTHHPPPIHPSLPDAPVLAAPRSICCDSKFRRPTGACRVLARAISALTAIASVTRRPGSRPGQPVHQAHQRCTMTALLRALLPTEVNESQQT